VKNLERLSKKQSVNQATDQSGTVEFFFAAENMGHNVARSFEKSSPQTAFTFARQLLSRSEQPLG